jgi:hypothetical protein
MGVGGRKEGEKKMEARERENEKMMTGWIQDQPLPPTPPPPSRIRDHSDGGGGKPQRLLLSDTDKKR